jgi:hypothetical protein
MGYLRELLNQIVDAGFNLVALLISPKKWTAFQTALSYSKTMLATAGKFMPIVAVLTGGQPTISQTPPARPEEVGPHMPSQSPQQPTAQPMRTVMVATTSAPYSVASFINTTDRFKQHRPDSSRIQSPPPES